MTADETSIPLFVTPGHEGDDSLMLRFPDEFSEEVLALLDEHGIEHGRAMEFSDGAELWIETVKVLGSTGLLVTLASVIKTLVQRNDQKSFKLTREGFEVQADGYPAKKVDKWLQQLSEQQAELDAREREYRQGISSEPDEESDDK